MLIEHFQWLFGDLNGDIVILRNNLRLSSQVIFQCVNIVETRTLNDLLQTSDIKNEDSIKVLVLEIQKFISKILSESISFIEGGEM